MKEGKRDDTAGTEGDWVKKKKSDGKFGKKQDESSNP